MLKKITTLAIFLISTKQVAAPNNIPSSLFYASPEIAAHYLAIELTNKFFLIEQQITQPDQTEYLNQKYPQLQFALGKGPFEYNPQNYSDTADINDCTLMEQIIGNWLLYRNTRIGDFSLTRAHSMMPNIQTQQPLQTLITIMFTSNSRNRLLRLANNSNQDQVLTKEQICYNIQQTILASMLNLPQDQNIPYKLQTELINNHVIFLIFKKSIQKDIVPIE